MRQLEIIYIHIDRVIIEWECQEGFGRHVAAKAQCAFSTCACKLSHTSKHRKMKVLSFACSVLFLIGEQRTARRNSVFSPLQRPEVRFYPSGGVVALTLSPEKVLSVTFLISINNTEQGCMYTTKSPAIPPDLPYNKSQSFSVGNCDHGPLTYTITTEKCIGVIIMAYAPRTT